MDPDDPLTFGEDPAGIAPERALVFEIAGSVTDFRRAVSKVDGLELLGDEDTVRARIAAYRDAGVNTLRVEPAGSDLAERLETLGRTMDIVRGLDNG